MDQQQHTPGPWKAWFRCRNQRTHIGDWCFVGADGSSPVKLGGTVECNPTAHANARLIAAAPDMLEALRPFAEWARQYELSTAGDIRDEVMLQSLRRARAAIAKATGAPDA